ncbi:MAG TPA: PfkB family carbohydrate kinase, partial [Egibacteraceae bacterium]|nr:PfkB family carbohydrate kinase [Egibacteraceae bacterium]
MREGRLVVVGDALLDRDVDGKAERLAPDAPVPVVDNPEWRARPGGAALAAALAAADGRPVTLVTALGEDPAGRTVRLLLEECGVQVHDLGLRGRTPEKVRVCAEGRPVVRMDLGGEPGEVGPATSGTGALLE